MPITAPDLPTAEHLRRKAPYLLLALVVLILDQWSKWLVEGRLEIHRSLEVIPDFFNLTLVRNTGVAFGLFASHGDATGTLLLLLLGFGALAFVGVYFWLTPLWDRLLLTSLGLVIGGALGNLIDRMTQGSVTDFFDFYIGTYHWHTFNVADTAISVGIGLMVLSAFRQPPAEETGEIPDEAAIPGDGDATGTGAVEDGVPGVR